MAPAAAAGKPTTPDDLANATKSSLDDFESMIGRPHWDLFRCLMHFSQEGALKDYRFDKIEDCPPLPEVEDPIRSVPNTPSASATQSPMPTEEFARMDLSDGDETPAAAPPTAERTWTESILGRFW